MNRIALLTDARWVSPEKPDWYAQNILDEDALLSTALELLDWQTERVAWDDADVDWGSYRAAVFRTTWDYFDRFAEFSAWLEQIATRLPLINPASIIRWNMDKHYLLDLTERGVPTVPSLFAEAGSDVTLAQRVAHSGWSELVLKPAVSGAGRYTYRLARGAEAELEKTYADLMAVESMMLQPMQRAIAEEGELSLMVFGDRVTHAVRKIARPGDFRVQDDYGGTVVEHRPTAEQIELAHTALAACESMPAYARVDMVRSNAGRYEVMELELVEPELWLRLHPPAALEFARALDAELAGERPVGASSGAIP